MSDEKQTEVKKPIEDKKLDDVSGGYIQVDPISIKAPHRPFPIKPGGPEPC